MKNILIILALVFSTSQAHAAENCKMVIPTYIDAPIDFFYYQLLMDRIVDVFRSRGYEVYPNAKNGVTDDDIKRISDRYLGTTIHRRRSSTKGDFDPYAFCSISIEDNQFTSTSRGSIVLNRYSVTEYGPPPIHSSDLCMTVIDNLAKHIKPCGGSLPPTPPPSDDDLPEYCKNPKSSEDLTDCLIWKNAHGK